MDEAFWKDRLVNQRHVLEYDENSKLAKIHWDKIHTGMRSPLVFFDDDEARALWNILLDEGIVSLVEGRNYGLFDGRMFAGPRSRNSGMPLFFTKREDAQAYKKEFFTKHQNHVSIIKIDVVG